MALEPLTEEEAAKIRKILFAGAKNTIKRYGGKSAQTSYSYTWHENSEGVWERVQHVHSTDADDVTQDAFIRLCTIRHPLWGSVYPPRSDLEKWRRDGEWDGWLYRYAENKAKHHLRKLEVFQEPRKDGTKRPKRMYVQIRDDIRCDEAASNDPTSGEFDPRGGFTPEWDTGPYVVLPSKDSNAYKKLLIKELLAAMKPDEARVLVMWALHGMTQAEIAVAEGVSQPAIYKRIQQARKHAREILGSRPAK